MLLIMTGKDELMGELVFFGCMEESFRKLFSSSINESSDLCVCILRMIMRFEKSERM